MKKILFLIISVSILVGLADFAFCGSRHDSDARLAYLYYSGAMTGYATPPQTVPYWNNWDSPFYSGGYGGYGCYPGYWAPYAKPESKDVSPYNFEVKPAGRVAIHTDPEDAQVFLDGVKLQQLPDLSYQIVLLAGTHHLNIIKDGYEEFSEDITVQAGSGLVVPISLKKKESVTQKP